VRADRLLGDACDLGELGRRERLARDQRGQDLGSRMVADSAPQSVQCSVRLSWFDLRRKCVLDKCEP
jgi:hypothetical protein